MTAIKAPFGNRLGLAAFVIVSVLAGTGCGWLEPTSPSTTLPTTRAAATTTVGTTSAAVATPPTTGALPPTMPAAPPADLCTSYEDPTVSGTVASPAVVEASGIAISRLHPGTLWMHNDSGGGAIIYASDLAGNHLGTFELDTLAFDWEDMAIGPGPSPDRDYLYLGDIGDNLEFRDAVTVVRVVEPSPDPAGGTITELARFDLVYPEAGYDSEAMAVDPVTGDILIVTKGSSGNPALIFRAPADQLSDGASTDLVPVGSFPLDPGLFVTAADIDRTGSTIVFRGYNEVWLWQRTDLEFVDTFAGEPCRTPSTAEIQGESIAFAADGFSYFTVSEGANPDINYVQSRADE